MTKNAGSIAAVLAIMTVFSSCGVNSEQGISDMAEVFSQSETFSVMTTTTVSETVTFCDEDVFDEVSEIGTEASKPEELSFPVVTPADEVYEFYPVKIIYPEKQETAVKITMETVREDMYDPDGSLVMKFSAEYPVISGIDESVCRKINDNMKAHADAAIEKAQEWADSYETPNDAAKDLLTMENAIPREYTVNTAGTYFEGSGCEINGNIFTVYFAVNDIIFPAAHGSEEPAPVMFDLRTGDEIYFSDLIGDKSKIAELFSRAYRSGAVMRGMLPCGELEADKASEWLAYDENIEDHYYANEKISVRDGCIGFYLEPNDEGDAFWSGIKFRHLPAKDFIPYLNEKGKELFEGYVSAESVPANVIEYKGGKYFDITEWIPNILDNDNLTEGDREFISLFKNASKRELEKYGLEYPN